MQFVFTSPIAVKAIKIVSSAALHTYVITICFDSRVSVYKQMSLFSYILQPRKKLRRKLLSAKFLHKKFHKNKIST